MLKEVLSLKSALTDIISIISKPKTFLLELKEKGWTVFITKTIRMLLLLEVILFAMSIPLSYSKISIFKELLVINTTWNLLYPIAVLCCFYVVNMVLDMGASCLEVFYYAFMYRIVILFPVYFFYKIYLYTENVYIFIANTYLLYIACLILLSGFGFLYGKNTIKKIVSVFIALFIMYGIALIINKVDTYGYVSKTIINNIPIYDPIPDEFSKTIDYCLDRQEYAIKINNDFIDLCDDYARQIRSRGKNLSIDVPSVEREYELLKKWNTAIINDINIYMEKIKFNSSKKTLRYIRELIEIETDIAKYTYEGFEYIKNGANEEWADRLNKRIDKVKEYKYLMKECYGFIKIKMSDIRILMKHDRIWFLPSHITN